MMSGEGFKDGDGLKKSVLDLHGYLDGKGACGYVSVGKYHLEFTCFALSCEGAGFGGAVVTSDECVQLQITAQSHAAKQWSFRSKPRRQPHLHISSSWLRLHLRIVIITVVNHPLFYFS